MMKQPSSQHNISQRYTAPYYCYNIMVEVHPKVDGDGFNMLELVLVLLLEDVDDVL